MAGVSAPAYALEDGRASGRSSLPPARRSRAACSAARRRSRWRFASGCRRSCGTCRFASIRPGTSIAPAPCPGGRAEFPLRSDQRARFAVWTIASCFAASPSVIAFAGFTRRTTSTTPSWPRAMDQIAGGAARRRDEHVEGCRRGHCSPAACPRSIAYSQFLTYQCPIPTIRKPPDFPLRLGRDERPVESAAEVQHVAEALGGAGRGGGGIGPAHHAASRSPN